MKKIFQRALSGVLSVLFVGQIMIYGDGSSQGIAHADTIAEIKESLELSGNADELKQEFYEQTEELGNIDYFSFPEVSLMSNAPTGFSDSLAVTGFIGQYGTNTDLTKVKILIFDGWDLAAETTANENGWFYINSGSIGSETNIKIECDGYLPRFYKGMGWGAYQIGTEAEPEMLYPGDTAYNADNGNQWSDEQITEDDALYVQSCIGAYAGDDGYNPGCDLNGDGTITQEEIDELTDYLNSIDPVDVTMIAAWDINDDWLIDNNDLEILKLYENYEVTEDIAHLDVNQNGIIDSEDITAYTEYLNSTEAFLYMMDLNGDNVVNSDDIDYLSDKLNLRSRSLNYFEYMDIYSEDRTITIEDYNWFKEYCTQYAGYTSENSYKKNIKLTADCYVDGSFNLHDGNLDLNGYYLTVYDCMSFTTDNPNLWDNNTGAFLNVNSGGLIVYNNLVFRTASTDGWDGNAGQTFDLNGGTVEIGGDFNFGQANCYDTLLMTTAGSQLTIYGNWNYITLTDMEGKWTNGTIYFEGPVWEVNEASGEKSVYSSGEHVISLYYPYGQQTILWDNRYTYVEDENGNPTTNRHLNFDYFDEEYEMGGVYFPYGYSDEMYNIRPWFPKEKYPSEPDYSLYRKGWEIGDGVHIATGNYTKSFTDLSISSPGVKSDFVRTYNSMNKEEGSFGIGWDFNIDVSRIIIPADGYYQVVLPDGSNTTFKDDVNGGYECLNAHSTMAKNGSEYIITNAAQSKYYFNADGEMYKVEDDAGNKLEVSVKQNNKRTVTDSTGRKYIITYSSDTEHPRVIQIDDVTGDRTVKYNYNSENQLVSAVSVSGAVEKYEYDENGRLNKIVNFNNEVTDQIKYRSHGEVDYLINSSGLKQEYKYNKSQKHTETKEYSGNEIVKTYSYNYDEKYTVNTNKITADGKAYEAEKSKFNLINGENKYDEVAESADIMGNVTKYERDSNGNVIKTINPDGTVTLANYNNKNSLIAYVDEMGNAEINAYDTDGVTLLKEAKSLKALTQNEINDITANNFDPIVYINEHESSYAVTSYEYFADSYVSGVIGLIKKTTDPEGNITEYEYYKDGLGKGLIKEKWIYGNGISKSANGTRYEYNKQLQVSKEISPEGYVKEYEYDKFDNVTVTRLGSGENVIKTIYEYDGLGRKIKEYEGNYSESKDKYKSFSYYPNNLVKSETDAEGNVTSYEYDVYGNVIKKTNSDGTVNITEYDGLQREKATYFKWKADAEKQILTSTAYEFAKNHSFDVYTALDSSSSKSCSGLKTIKTTYITADKQVVNETLTDFRGNAVIEKTNGETKSTSAYYANGQLARAMDSLGNTTKYEYQSLNSLTKTYVPFNSNSDGSINYSITENQYDKNGNVILTKQTVQKQDSSNVKYSITQNKYNGYGLLSEVILSDGTVNGEKNITKYFYDRDQLKTKMYTGLSSENDTDYLITYYETDEWGRLIRTTDSAGYDSGLTVYDKSGNIIKTTDANGNVTTNTYDALNRLLTSNTVNPSDSSKNVSKSYTYDSMGRITQTVSNGLTTNTVYDDLGRKYTETESDGNGYSVFRGFFYEGVSQYVSKELTGQYHLLFYSDKTYEYDGEMRVVKVRESGNETVSYTYDANGNKKSETLANGAVSTYTYNKANRITKIENKSGNTDISSYEYSYYLDGSDACKVRSESGIIETTSYEYDGLKRLTEEAVKVGNNTTDTYTYEYDDYGNRSKMTAEGTEDYVTEYSYVDSNGKYTALLQKEVKTAEADENLINLNPASNVKQTVYAYDANGNQITKTAEGKTETNTYNGLNQLIGYTDGETIASYKYNASGLRYEKTVDGQTINHVWDGNKQIVADIIDNQFYEADCYIRGTNLVAKYNYRNGNKSEYTYYTQNAHGDVVNLTDSTGVVTKKYTYDAFGVEKNIDDGDTNAFRYCGEYYDTETGTIYLRARYYNPINGRFTSRDTALGNPTDPLSLNLYTYCHNNPVLGVDPSGHFFETLLDVVGLVVDVVDFVKEPSVGGFVDIAWDIGGLLVPGVPGSYAGDAVEAVHDVTKAVDKAHDVKKAANAADAAGDLGKAAKKLDTASDAYKDIDRSTEVLQQGKKVPNQYGKKGCPEHRAEIDKAVDDMQKRGLDTATEYKFDTYGGYKNSRYADAVGIKDGKIVEIHQVGVSTKRGLPVSRERKAISDIENSTGINVTFHSYKRR